MEMATKSRRRLTILARHHLQAPGTPGVRPGAPAPSPAAVSPWSDASGAIRAAWQAESTDVSVWAGRRKTCRVLSLADHTYFEEHE
jgi:hypothetical protein